MTIEISSVESIKRVGLHKLWIWPYYHKIQSNSRLLSKNENRDDMKNFSSDATSIQSTVLRCSVRRTAVMRCWNSESPLLLLLLLIGRLQGIIASALLLQLQLLQGAQLLQVTQLLCLFLWRRLRPEAILGRLRWQHRQIGVVVRRCKSHTHTHANVRHGLQPHRIFTATGTYSQFKCKANKHYKNRLLQSVYRIMLYVLCTKS